MTHVLQLFSNHKSLSIRKLLLISTVLTYSSPTRTINASNTQSSAVLQAWYYAHRVANRRSSTGCCDPRRGSAVHGGSTTCSAVGYVFSFATAMKRELPFPSGSGELRVSRLRLCCAGQVLGFCVVCAGKDVRIGWRVSWGFQKEVTHTSGH
ncbi:hypothetical protein EDB87DRAFT_384576 [Lactarius vividus]|nr:hypothetical protein EDB87DRAFT_384576 [Lactarius vividus]